MNINSFQLIYVQHERPNDHYGTQIIDDITKVLKQTCETDHPYLVMLV